jgi:hypothetical protein
VRGEIYRRFEIVPDAAVNLAESVLIFADRSPKQVAVVVRAGAAAVSGTVQLKLPQGWTSEPSAAPFDLKTKNAVQTVRFAVSPREDATGGNFTAEASANGKTFSIGMAAIDYAHIPQQTVFTPAEGKLVLLDLKKNGRNIGYIQGSGDAIPEALLQIGYSVTLLTDEALVDGDLAVFDTIITGARAYNTREILKSAQPRLLEYVRNGGTLVVQYNTTQDLVQDAIGPYPLKISRERVSVEDAPVTILAHDHPLMNFPNRITADDFTGWVQERGLYFPGEWDPQYQTVIASNDPGEPARPGGLLYASYGKGIYIYTAYSWFRELPAGVPGAFRLFVNLISAR